MSGDIPISSRPSFREVIFDPVYCVALGFGSGLSPKAPGTAGSALAIVPFLLLTKLPIWAYVAVVIIGFGVGVYICEMAARRLAVKDPGMVVWDEFIGLWIALTWLPPGWYYILIGFGLFRFFDILKPWPISYLDRHIGGGLGIMVDDVVAGFFAFVVLQALVLVAASVL